MEWFRHYHGLASDPKLTSVALTAEVHHCIAVAAWCFVLEHASGNDARGNTVGISAKVMAIGLRITMAEADRLLIAFADEGMILPDGSVKAWEKRQKRSDTSADRVRKWREKRVTEAPVTNDETPQGGNVTLQGDTVTSLAGARVRAEQNREDSTPVRGADAPNAKAALWREMKAQIGGTDPGGLVVKWLKQYGDAEVIAAHFAAMANTPMDYITWMTKRLQANGKPYSTRMARNGNRRRGDPMEAFHENIARMEQEDDEHSQGGLEAISGVSFSPAFVMPGSRSVS